VSRQQQTRAGKQIAAGASAFFLLIAAATFAGPSASTDLREALAEQLSRRSADPAAWAKQMKQGEERSAFCAHCHGKDGNSVMPVVPNLAGQNPFYLLDQFEKFADGRREDYIMTPLARQLSPDDKVLIAIYYASLSVRPARADSVLAEKGAALYHARCIACHSADAHGSENYARLAGQRVQYLKHRLYMIQTNAVAASPMTGVARTLTDEDIEALTAYLSSLP
jgi:cytochrome c553